MVKDQFFSTLIEGLEKFRLHILNLYETKKPLLIDIGSYVWSIGVECKDKLVDIVLFFLEDL